jgi:hypothetical protein
MKDYLTDDRFTIKLPRLTKGIDNDRVLIIPASPPLHHTILERFGYYFKRELRYDFPAFEPSEDQMYMAWIFAWNQGLDGWRAFGACEFNPGDAPRGGWWLEWIWFHPYFRGKGYLKKAWSSFVAELKTAIEVRPPFSRAMLSFLRSVDPKTLGTETKQRLQKPGN